MEIYSFEAKFINFNFDLSTPEQQQKLLNINSGILLLSSERQNLFLSVLDLSSFYSVSILIAQTLFYCFC